MTMAFTFCSKKHSSFNNPGLTWSELSDCIVSQFNNLFLLCLGIFIVCCHFVGGAPSNSKLLDFSNYSKFSDSVHISVNLPWVWSNILPFPPDGEG